MNLLLMTCASTRRSVVLLLEFIELIQTDQEFQMKVGAISAALLGGAVLAGRGRKYNITTPESSWDVMLYHSLVIRPYFQRFKF